MPDFSHEATEPRISAKVPAVGQFGLLHDFVILSAAVFPAAPP